MVYTSVLSPFSASHETASTAELLPDCAGMQLRERAPQATVSLVEDQKLVSQAAREDELRIRTCGILLGP